MVFTPGQSGNPAGRPKGAKGKVSKDVVQQILQALDDKGGVDYLKKLDDKLLVALIGRVVPRDVNLTTHSGLDADNLAQALKAGANGDGKSS